MCAAPPPSRPLIPRHWRRPGALALVAGVVAGTVWLGLDLAERSALRCPPPTPLFEDRRGGYLTESGDEEARRGYWPADHPFPERVAACLLAIEDHRFEHHDGVDPPALLRAAWHNLTGGPRQGASTLAMQVARLQDPGPPTLPRKLREMIVARLLVARHGRAAVLRHYLRLVPQGNQIHGVAYSARRYFRKPVQDLGWAEAALLAALPKAPGRFNLFRPDGFRAARTRAERVLRALHRQGVLDPAGLRDAQAQLHRLHLPVRELRPLHSMHAILRLLADPATREAIGQRPVRTTLDPELQDTLQTLADRAMAAQRPRGAGNIAVLVVERAGGAVRGYLGSAGYTDPTWAGSIDYVRVPRSSGSTIKPFLYAAGLADDRFQPTTVLADLPLHLSGPGGDYTVSNYDDSFQGPVLLRRALANSRNVPAVQVLRAVGLERAFGLLGRVGLTRPGQRAADHGLGLAIGGLYTSLEQLVGAYAILAADGRPAPLILWEGPAAERPTPTDPLVDESAARAVLQYLSDPLARLPAFARYGVLDYPFPVAVKTGTSQGFRDAWTVAVGPAHIVGVWIGHPRHERMNEVSGLAAAAVVRAVFAHLHPDAFRDLDLPAFPAPRGWAAARICPLSGAEAGPECPETVWEHLPPDHPPAPTCPVHRRLALDRRTGQRAGVDTPAEQVEWRPVVHLPPEYATWAARRGLTTPPAPLSGPPVAQVTIRQPANGSRFRLDPETPAAFQTVPLRAVVTPAVPTIEWVVNDQPLPPVPYPYEIRWPLQPGRHTIQARFPRADIRSAPVTITVQAD